MTFEKFHMEGRRFGCLHDGVAKNRTTLTILMKGKANPLLLDDFELLDLVFLGRRIDSYDNSILSLGSNQQSTHISFI